MPGFFCVRNMEMKINCLRNTEEKTTIGAIAKTKQKEGLPMVIYFDLDGTLADLYSVPDWLDKLHAEDTEPYSKAAIIHPTLPSLLNALRAAGATLGVISWGAMGGSNGYTKLTKAAKLEWCNRHFGNVFSEFHVIKYGTPKSKAAKHRNAILVDDNAKVRTSWENSKAANVEMPTIDASDTLAMIEALRGICEQLMN